MKKIVLVSAMTAFALFQSLSSLSAKTTYNIKVCTKSGENYIKTSTPIEAMPVSTLLLLNEPRTFTVNGVSFTMISVKGGTFQMGTNDIEALDNELTISLNGRIQKEEIPVHQVTLNDYYIGETEVTQELWVAVMGQNPSVDKCAKYPVTNVSWDDCQKFIKKLNRQTGQTFRFPTEQEWEFAARGGNNSRGYKYSGSDNLDSVAWYKENSDGKLHTVGSKSPNELGIYDMSGNVFEFIVASDSSRYRIRGGHFNYRACYCHVANPGRTCNDRAYCVGLRLAY